MRESVQAEVMMSFLVSEELSFRIPVELRYESCDPYAVRLTFHLPGDAPVTWAFGPLTAGVLLPWLTLPLAATVVRTVRNRSDGPSLNRALARAGILQLAFCVLLAAGLLLSR